MVIHKGVGICIYIYIVIISHTHLNQNAEFVFRHSYLLNSCRMEHFIVIGMKEKQSNSNSFHKIQT